MGAGLGASLLPPRPTAPHLGPRQGLSGLLSDRFHIQVVGALGLRAKVLGGGAEMNGPVLDPELDVPT
jgi:hypothetical protein